jgi:transposase
MPAPIDPTLKAQIRRVYVTTKLSEQEIANQFGVSDRSIRNWAKDENWEAERKAENVIEFARKPKQPETVRIVPTSEDPLEIATMTIKDLQGEMASDVGGRDMAAIAKELREWVKYRDELLKPKTAEGFADQLIASGVSIREFVQLLKQRA